MSDTPETDAAVVASGGDWSPVLRAVSQRLERERDEARIDRANGDIATMTRNHYERILRERDEARGLLRILAGLVAYGLGQSGEEWSLEAMRQATTAIQNAKSLEAAK